MFDLIPWKRSGERRGDVTVGKEFEPFARMRDEFDRLFDDFFRGWPTLASEGSESRWGLDLEDKGNQTVVRAEAPGFEPDDFDVQIRGNQLILRASHKAEKEDEEKNFRSWQQQELYRSVTLPEGTDPDKVNARYKNGVLTVSLPKTGKSNGKKIAIKG